MLNPIKIFFQVQMNILLIKKYKCVRKNKQYSENVVKIIQKV